MKLNLDNKYHCQLPRAGETRRQRPLTRHRAHSRAPRDRGLHHLRDPAPTIGVFPAGVEPATQTGHFTSPGGGGSRSTLQGPRTCPREAPGRGSKDRIGHPMSPGSPRAGLLRTTQRSSHVPGEPQGGAPRTTAVSHGVGAISEPALGGGVPGPDQAIQPPHIGPGCTPSSPASPGFRQLGRRRKPGIWQGCSAGDGPHEQNSCVGAYAGTGGAQTPASHVLLQPRGEADRAVGSALPQSQPPVPVILPLLSWKPPPVGDSAETALKASRAPSPLASLRPR